MNTTIGCIDPLRQFKGLLGATFFITMYPLVGTYRRIDCKYFVLNSLYLIFVADHLYHNIIMLILYMYEK